MNQHIESTTTGRVLFIRLNRPEAKNAISLAMYQQLTDVLTSYEQNEELHVAVLIGDTECFTAGNDLADFMANPELDQNHPTVRFLNKVSQMSKPLIAAVAGPAIGIGTTVLLHCDYVVAANNSRFQLPFAQLGVCPELASSKLLTELVGHQKAFELLTFGEPFSAQQALEMGLINALCSADELVTLITQRAEQLAALPLQSVLATKKLIKDANLKTTRQAIADELHYFQRLLNSEQTQQRIAAVFNKKR